MSRMKNLVIELGEAGAAAIVEQYTAINPDSTYQVFLLTELGGTFCLPDMDGGFLLEFIEAARGFQREPAFYRAFEKTSDSATGVRFAKAWMVKDRAVTEWNDVTIPREFA